MGEQPALAIESPAIAGQRSVCADHPMAGNDDGDGIGAIGETDGARGRGAADLGGQSAVADAVPGRDAAQRVPDRALEIRAVGGDG